MLGLLGVSVKSCNCSCTHLPHCQNSSTTSKTRGGTSVAAASLDICWNAAALQTEHRDMAVLSSNLHRQRFTDAALVKQCKHESTRHA
jgi:hypothetical protein